MGNRLDKVLRHFAVARLTMVLVVGQGLAFLLNFAQQDLILRMILTREQVLAGEVWRLASFVFLPPLLDLQSWMLGINVFFFILYLLAFWFIGHALENEWGPARYTRYLATGYLLTVAAVFALPGQLGDSYFTFTTVFLAFAYLFPRFEFLLFFVLPVQVRWLALITWIFLGIAVLSGGGGALLALAIVLTFLISFGRELFQRLRGAQRRMARHAERAREAGAHFHRCVVCGRTDVSDPGLEFRYCDKCAGAPCYCLEHLNQHAHR